VISFSRACHSPPHSNTKEAKTFCFTSDLDKGVSHFLSTFSLLILPENMCLLNKFDPVFLIGIFLMFLPVVEFYTCKVLL